MFQFFSNVSAACQQAHFSTVQNGCSQAILSKFGFFVSKPTFAAELKRKNMYWTLELASYLEEAPWPATKDELIDYAIRSGAPIEVVENLQELDDEGEIYESIEDIWPDYPTQDDFMFNDDEY
jgi:hypothetical protein